ncbi:protein phosphatase 2C domain-containing protein [Candidatus Uhrbacteria bacterium]|nr:protein phosphatase 2C domain-containing protein [Candidatus Uhrbacteria bacterium]
MPINPNKPPNTPGIATQNVIPVREPGIFQERGVVPAQEVTGFTGCRVYLTMERKPPEDPKSDQRNEDNVLADPRTGLMGVMDGLGGVSHGDLASKAVERLLPKAFTEALTAVSAETAGVLANRLAKSQKQKLTGLGDPDAIAEKLEEMKTKLTKADPAIVRKAWALIKALRDINEQVRGSGGMTTACIGMVHETPKGSRYAIVANVGDSGAFIRRKDGTVERLTTEDSQLDELMRCGIQIGDQTLKDHLNSLRDRRTGKINMKTVIKIPITPESCRVFGYSEKGCELLMKSNQKTFDQEYGNLKVAVNRALGDKTPPVPSLEIVKLESGDEILFCTDGVIDKYENEQTGDTDLSELSMDLELADDALDQLDTLRVISAQRRVHFKYIDDIAIVMAAIK